MRLIVLADGQCPSDSSSTTGHAHQRTGLRHLPCYCHPVASSIVDRLRALRARWCSKSRQLSFRLPPSDTPCRSHRPAGLGLYPYVRPFHDVRMLGQLVAELLLCQALSRTQLFVRRFVNCLHRNPFNACIVLRLHPSDNFLHQSVVFLRHFCITSASSESITAYSIGNR